MKTTFLLRFVLALAAILAAIPAVAGADALSPVELRCEYRENPVGVDAVQPRLFWKLQSSERGQRQTACQVLAASSAELLAQDRGDLWDSGKQMSDETIQIAYGGVPLKSSQMVFWKVRVWDAQDARSDWSKPAAWTMGLLQPADWQAKWIGAKPAAQASLAGAHWVWYPEGSPAQAAPPGTRYFRRQFQLPEGKAIRSARLVAAVDNECRLFLNGRRLGRAEGWQTCATFDILPGLVPGTNVVGIIAVNGAQAPNPAGFLGQIEIQFMDGEKLVLGTDATWSVAKSEILGWLEPNFRAPAWLPAKVLGQAGLAPWGEIHAPAGALPVFRREFQVSQPVRRAVLHICGLGYYELRLNGRKIGDQVLDPGWTEYHKTCLYSSHDVTRQIVAGPNALGVLLGNGMFNVTGGRYVKYTGSHGSPKLILQLRLDYEDGSTQLVVSDESWKSQPGPIQFSCIYGGEDYDARRELPRWDQPGSSGPGWDAVAITEGPGGRLTAQSAPPVKVMRQYRSVKISRPQPGVFVYDLGQNMSGWPRLTVQGKAGQTVKLIPGELLEANGLVSQRSSGGPVWFSYTLKGDGAEPWQPRFTYYGFRYVQVEGAVPVAEAGTDSDSPKILELGGDFIYSSARRVGEFSCSNELLNRIHELILRAIESNLHSVLTDCPHREKLGWLEVSHLLGPAIMFNYEVPALYDKICRDMRDSQLPNGLVPDIAPEYTVFGGGFRDSPEWGSACVINPWHLYQRYGDRQVLADQYDAMARYAAYLGSQAKDHIVAHGLGDWYDIGPGGPGESKLTTKGLTATAIYYHNITILEAAAQLLGKTEDAARYAALARAVSAAFNRKFFHPESNSYDRGSQTANAMPLVFGLVDPARRAAVLENIVKDVRAHQNHVTAGDIGFRYLMMALSRGGRSDLLFAMNTHTNPPSYGSQLARGATTLTEAWDANPASSQNHCMLGHAEEWFYTDVAGILPDPESIAFRHVLIYPQMVGDLTWAKASYDSVRGRIASEWHKQTGQVTLRVDIPPNVTATVYVPAKSAEAVKEGGVSALRSPGVKFLRQETDRALFAVSSGTYVFEVAE